VTSPPYWGLRDYGVAEQIGQEKTLEEYITNLVAIFTEVHRVLRNDGTCFIVIGDSYARTGKNLMLVPQYLGIVLQQNHWIVRQECIWSKKNPLPESVTDRFTKSHETIWFLSKSPKYYWDRTAAQEEALYPAGMIATASLSGKTSDDPFIASQNHHGLAYVTNGKPTKRDVFTTSTNKDAGAKNAHFAVFPESLVEIMLLPGCPPDGECLDLFAGSGTLGAVAVKHGRRATLIELNPEYCSIIEEDWDAKQYAPREGAASGGCTLGEGSIILRAFRNTTSFQTTLNISAEKRTVSPVFIIEIHFADLKISVGRQALWNNFHCSRVCANTCSFTSK